MDNILHFKGSGYSKEKTRLLLCNRSSQHVSELVLEGEKYDKQQQKQIWLLKEKIASKKRKERLKTIYDSMIHCTSCLDEACECILPSFSPKPSLSQSFLPLSTDIYPFMKRAITESTEFVPKCLYTAGHRLQCDKNNDKLLFRSENVAVTSTMSSHTVSQSQNSHGSFRFQLPFGAVSETVQCSCIAHNCESTVQSPVRWFEENSLSTVERHKKTSLGYLGNIKSGNIIDSVPDNNIINLSHCPWLAEVPLPRFHEEDLDSTSLPSCINGQYGAENTNSVETFSTNSCENDTLTNVSCIPDEQQYKKVMLSNFLEELTNENPTFPRSHHESKSKHEVYLSSDHMLQQNAKHRQKQDLTRKRSPNSQTLVGREKRIIVSQQACHRPRFTSVMSHSESLTRLSPEQDFDNVMHEIKALKLKSLNG